MTFAEQISIISFAVILVFLYGRLSEKPFPV